MKFIIVSLFSALVFSAVGTASAKERCGVSVDGGVDMVSGYVWRGVSQAGPSFQPVLTFSAGSFSVTAWGSVDFAATSYKEMDLTVAYAIGPVTLSLADLYWEGSSADREAISRNYFHFGSDSPHRVEVGMNWRITDRIPITLSWNTVLFGPADVDADGRRAYATYIEVAYSFTVATVEMKAGIGAVPWNAYGTYGIDRDFYVQNVFLSASRMWEIRGADSMRLGLSTQLVWNPATEDVNFIGGISFRM